MKSTGGRLRGHEKAGKFLGLEEKQNGERHTSFTLVGADSQ